MKTHAFGHSVFGRFLKLDFREILGSPEDGRSPRPRKPSALLLIMSYEAGRRPRDRSFKHIRKLNEILQILSLCICITKIIMHCDACQLNRFQNSHPFGN